MIETRIKINLLIKDSSKLKQEISNTEGVGIPHFEPFSKGEYFKRAAAVAF